MRKDRGLQMPVDEADVIWPEDEEIELWKKIQKKKREENKDNGWKPLGCNDRRCCCKFA